MKKQLVLFIALFCCFSCASQKKEIIAKSTIKLEGRNTNIQDFIEINGYYIRSDSPQYGSILFFEDGTWVYFHFKRDVSDNEKKSNMSESVTSWIEDKQIRWGSYWGVYEIKGDCLFLI